MNDTSHPLLALTAADLMSRDVETVGADTPLRDAATRMARREVHGLPVVDGAGRCVGVLSVSDLARWAANLGAPRDRLPLACSFQEPAREPGGRETLLCKLPEGVCPLQRVREMADGRVAIGCSEPHSIPTDWQTVETAGEPGEMVRDFMTTTIFTADPTTTVPQLARLMLDNRVHRLLVLDPDRRPVGVVTANDLLQVIAHPELSPAGAR